jgi:hypothetical protein
MTVNEIDVWMNNVPVIEQAGDYDFATWLDGVPVLEQGGQGGSGLERRRAEIF